MNEIEAIGEHLKGMGQELAEAKLRIAELEAELAQVERDRAMLARVVSVVKDEFREGYLLAVVKVLQEARNGDTE